MKQVLPLPAGTSFSGWTSALFLMVAGFSSLSLAPLPEVIRPPMLTIGAIGILVCAAVIVATQALSRSVALFISITFVMIFWAIAFPVAVNGDDNAAYLIYADFFYDRFNETIQPLSERRLFSVGGIYAFQAPLLHWFGLQSLTLIEPVLGLLLFASVFLSNQRMSAFLAFFMIGFLAILPALGSKILANTSSAFVLGALSYALIVLALRIKLSSRPSTVDIALVLALPLTALLFRPTTAPFNGLVAAGTLLLILLTGREGWFRVGMLSVPILAAFVAALLPYHAVGQTYLYPLFGRGTHMSGTGNFIPGFEYFDTHLINIFVSTSSDPLFLAATLAAILAVRTIESKLRSTFAVILLAYLIFTCSIIVSTNGLASMRYVTPVSMALLFASLPIVLGAVALHLERLKIELFGANYFLMAGIVVGLLLIRVVSQGVVDQRLKGHELSLGTQGELQQIAETINQSIEPSERVLLIGINDGRFLIDLLDNNVLIMDQPGALLPWRPEIADYSEGLQSFLERKQVTAVVSRPNVCGDAKIIEQPRGWANFMEYANTQNSVAICTLLGKRIKMEGYDLLFLRFH